MKDDLVLICGDGGVKGGFIAGAVTALFHHFPNELNRIKIIAASSASVGSMCYLISHGLNHPGRQIWTRELSSKKFLNVESLSSLFKSEELYNLDYMAYEIFKKKYPLDEKKINGGNPKFYFPVQNYDKMTVEFFSNSSENSFVRDGVEIPKHNIRNYNIYELIKAAGAAPFIYDKCIKISNANYMDAATIEPFTFDLPGMKGRRKIVILTKSDKPIRQAITYFLLGTLWPLFVNPFRKFHFKREIYRQYAKKPKVLRSLFNKLSSTRETDGDYLLITPTRKLGGLFHNDLQSLQQNFQHGEEVVKLNLEPIRSFFENGKLISFKR